MTSNRPHPPQAGGGSCGRGRGGHHQEGEEATVHLSTAMKEIEREESRPQAIHILRKRGEEVVVVEEEDTTREVKRLRSSLFTAMKQVEVSIALAVSVFGIGDHGPLQSWCFAGCNTLKLATF